MSDLPVGWTIHRLGDAGGLFARRVDRYAGVRPYLATSDVNQGKATPSEEFTYSGRPARADLLLKVNDVLQAKMKGTDKAFLVGKAQSGWLASTGFAQFNPRTVGNSSRYFLHVLSSRWFLDAKDARCVGSTQQAISDKDLAEIEIAVPPRLEQAGIADVLDAIDGAIRETEAITVKLAAFKQGLLNDLMTRGIGVNGELRPPQVEAPHLYKGSPLGWIPKDWSVEPLSHYTASDITYGIVQAGPHVPGGVPYIRTGDMSGDALIRESMLCTSRRIASSYARSEVRTGEIVMAIRATVGKVLPVPLDLDGANLTQGTARVSPNAKTDGTFLLWAIRHSRAQRAIQLEIKGTTFAEITLGALRQVLVAAPISLAEQNEIGKRLTVVDERLLVERESLAKYQSQKAGLMEDLLTGRVRVKPLPAEAKSEKECA